VVGGTEDTGRFAGDRGFGQTAVICLRRPSRDGVHIEDAKPNNGESLVAGTAGVVLTVVRTRATLKAAQQQADSRVKNILIPKMYCATTSATAGRRARPAVLLGLPPPRRGVGGPSRAEPHFRGATEAAITASHSELSGRSLRGPRPATARAGARPRARH